MERKSRRNVYEGRYLTIYEDEMIAPSGSV